uniref:sensor histidine kinase n=1 Tax=Flavobacterium sp. TaxID=239 RepID=UPI004048F5F7
MKKLFNDVKKELERIRIVEGYELFDTSPEEAYDNITFLASQVCQTPISTITLVDEQRQWFKSKIGFSHDGSPKSTSFCALAIANEEDITIVPNLMQDPDFSEIGRLNGLEKDGFYASVAIKNEKGVVLGTLCVIDYVSKTLTENQLKSLVILAKQVSDLFKLRLKNIQLSQNNNLLQDKYEELEQFTSAVSHDLKTPLNNIISLVQLVKENLHHTDSNSLTENETYVDYMVTSSYQLKNYIDDLLDFYKNNPNDLQREKFALSVIFDDIKQTLNPLGNFDFQFSTTVDEIFSYKITLKQILLNLVSNGIKYNASDSILIKIELKETPAFYTISVEDSGIGIEESKFELIFSEFETIPQKDRFGNYGKGLGLPKVKKLLEKIGGKIELISTVGKGSTFTVVIPKG